MGATYGIQPILQTDFAHFSMIDLAGQVDPGAEPSLGVMGLSRHVVTGLGIDVDVRYLAWRSDAPGGRF